MKQKILLTLAIIFVVLAAGLFYINKILLPVQIKGIVVKTIAEQTGRQVSLASLQWSPVRGIAISDLVIYDKEKPAEIFLHIPSASAQVLIVPFFSKKIIIPSVTISGLSLRIVKTGTMTWNFSDLIKIPKAGSVAAPAPDILVSSFSCTQTRIQIVDTSSGEEFSENINPLNFKGSLSLAAGLHVFGDMTVLSTAGTVKFDTRAGLRENTFQGDFKLTNINLARYQRFLPAPLPITLRDAAVKTAELAISSDAKGISVSGTASLPGLHLIPNDNMPVKTDLLLNKFSLTSQDGGISFQGDLAARKTEALINGQAIKGDFLANVSSLTLKDGRLKASADLQIKDFILETAQGLLIAGDLALSKAQVTAAGTDVDLQAQMKGERMKIKSGETRISSDLSADISSLTFKNGRIQASADLQLKGLAVETAPGLLVSGDLSLSQAGILVEGTRAELKTQMKCERMKIKSGNTLISSNLASPDLVIVHDAALDVRTTLKLTGTQVVLPQGISLVADSSGAIHLHLENSVLSYDGAIDLANGAIKGLPVLDTVKEIAGQIRLETDSAATSALSLKTLDTMINLSGSVTNFSHPLISLDAAALEVDLAIAERLAPQIFKDQGLKLSGKADITAHLEGEAANLDPAKITAKAAIKDAAVESSKFSQTLQRISGTITYAAPVISWKDLNVDFQKKTYTLNGHLQDFTNPYVSTSVKGIDLSADIEARKTGDTIHIASLTSALFDSAVNGKGDIVLTPGEDPRIHVITDAKIAIHDIPKILPQYEKNISDLKLSGTLKVTAAIEGAATDWKNWTADIAVSSPILSCMGYKVTNLNISAQERKGTLDPLEIKGTLYEGDAGIISSVNLLEDGFPLDTTFKIKGLNMALLKENLPALEQKQFSGSLSVSGTLKGKAADWKNMTGHSRVEIKNGYLWEFPILTKVLGLLSTSFQGGDVIITDASTSLTIADGRISTNDLLLQSTAVSLIGEGWVDLDQNVDINITPRIEPNTGSSASGLTSLNLTEGLLNIHVTGTLQKPKIESNLSAPTVIKKTLQNTVGNLLKIFE